MNQTRVTIQPGAAPIAVVRLAAGVIAHIYGQGQTHAQLELLLADETYGVVTDFTLTPYGLNGLHLLSVTQGALPAGESRLDLLLTSQTGLFEPWHVVVEVEAVSAQTLYNDVLSTLAANQAALSSALASLAAEVDALRAGVPYRHKEEYAYDAGRTKIVGLTRSVLRDPQSQNYNTPDYKVAVALGRGTDGLVESAEVQEVVL